MTDFVEGISDDRAAASLLRAIQGKGGAFRRFKDRLREDYPDLPRMPSNPVGQATRDRLVGRQCPRLDPDEPAD